MRVRRFGFTASIVPESLSRSSGPICWTSSHGSRGARHACSYCGSNPLTAPTAVLTFVQSVKICVAQLRPKNQALADPRGAYKRKGLVMSNRLNVAPNDLNAFWMPFTANRQFKQTPRMLVAAKDMHYTTSDGRQVL